jgi:hypothetical protein
MESELKGLEDHELVSLMLTGEEVRYLRATLDYVLKTALISKDNQRDMLKKLKKRCAGLVKA